MTEKNGDGFSEAAEEGPGGILNKMFPKMITQSAAKDWIKGRRAQIRPWKNFVDQRRFSRPPNFGEVCKRMTRNIEHFQSNYMFISLGLILYCIITSPMLLIALAVFFGGCYIIYLRTLQSKMVLFGRELSTANQYGLAGAVSFPFLWLAGAGAAVFWIIGATLVVIGSHASFHELEGESEELQMEPV
ncbi:Rab acceptor 1 (prenylated) S homeolog [Xenopus laevis]|uniref:PRA1 family protein n=1 Tax=Xenopus laevis TaxID=8355 RepID=Q6NU63_XENLA|nr:Rab acceptor 1 (prenylated) S homeolog [Xenopus laevis]AAH68737.1 MGC81207 protein [Xenopus laevis]